MCGEPGLGGRSDSRERREVGTGPGRVAAAPEKWRFLFQLIYLFIFLKRGVDICAQIFTAALFTVAKTRKQPKCLSADKYIKKMWCICIQ